VLHIGYPGNRVYWEWQNYFFKQMEIYFKELNITGWSGKTIVVDIDGTITTDGGSDVDLLVIKKIQDISVNNSVFLFSNKKLTDRDNEVANKLNVPLLKTSFKKPNKKVIDGIPDHLRKNLIVIGDKIIIDGLFAKNIGAEFIKVRRLTSKNDSFNTKLTYKLDNFVRYFIT
jgi:predicted HAD superfamily phosphohydrolase YqeG